MALPRGIKHFSNYLENYKSDYVIIGGGAAAVCLEDEGIDFRTTKDIDIVLFINNSDALNKKLSEYVSLGGYDDCEKTDKTPTYYSGRKI